MFNVRAEAVEASVSTTQSSYFLGASAAEWKVGILIAVLLTVLGGILRIIRSKTRQDAGRIPVLLLYVGRLFMSKDDWQYMFSTFWLPDQITMMRVEERTWKGRALRYGECCSYALSVALSGARQAHKALNEGKPRAPFYAPQRLRKALARLRTPLILALSTGIGCGFTAMFQDPLSFGRLAIGGALGFGFAWLALLFIAGIQSRAQRRD
ncbi:hypothetical protein ACPCUV_17945 [Streptomyces platensis]|uniref:hypothetical protein n=1 Tax=Streptomyces platensis TaxID=58346 RepID=UPI003C2F5BEB